MSTATDTPAADEQPETLAFEETKFPDKVARPTDRFKVHGYFAGLDDIRRANSNPELDEVSRSDMMLLGIKNITELCLRRVLEPLTSSAPEKLGLTLPDMLEQYLPKGNERSRRFEALFKLMRDSYTAAPELSQLCPECSNPQYVADAGFTLLQPELISSVLPLLVEEGFRFPDNFNEQHVQKLARRFILETPAARFAGKGSQSIMPQIVELLDTVSQDGIPRYANEIGIQLLRIMAAAAPHTEPVRTGLLRALRRYQRMLESEWAAEIAAAVECEYHCYLR